MTMTMYIMAGPALTFLTSLHLLLASFLRREASHSFKLTEHLTTLPIRSLLALLLLLCRVGLVHADHIVYVEENNAAMVYTGSWARTTDVDNMTSAGYNMYSNGDPTATATLKFTGDAVYVFSPKWPYKVAAWVSIDGSPPVRFDFQDHSVPATDGGRPSITSSMIGGEANLDPTIEHTLVLSTNADEGFLTMDMIAFSVPDVAGVSLPNTVSAAPVPTAEPAPAPQTTAQTTSSAPTMAATTTTSISTETAIASPQPANVTTAPDNEAAARMRTMIIAGGLVCAFIALLAIPLIIFLCKRKKEKKRMRWSLGESRLELGSDTRLRGVSAAPAAGGYRYSPPAYSQQAPRIGPVPVHLGSMDDYYERLHQRRQQQFYQGYRGYKEHHHHHHREMSSVDSSLSAKPVLSMSQAPTRPLVIHQDMERQDQQRVQFAQRIARPGPTPTPPPAQETPVVQTPTIKTSAPTPSPPPSTPPTVYQPPGLPGRRSTIIRKPTAPSFDPSARDANLPEDQHPPKPPMPPMPPVPASLTPSAAAAKRKSMKDRIRSRGAHRSMVIGTDSNSRTSHMVNPWDKDINLDEEESDDAKTLVGTFVPTGHQLAKATLVVLAPPTPRLR